LIENWPIFLQDNSRQPETVTEAVERLLLILDGEQKIAIAAMHENDLIDLHFSLGMAIRNVFGLHEPGSKLLVSINNTIHPDALYNSVHPDDASGVIVKAVWNKLVGVKGPL